MKAESCPDYVQAEWNHFLGKSIFFSPLDKETQKILHDMPSLSSAHIQKKLPHDLEITFDTQNPIYTIQTSPQQFFFVDESGTIVDSTATISGQVLPNIFISPQTLPLELHQQLSPHIHQHLFALTEFLLTHPLQYTSITLTSLNDLEILLPDGRTAQLRVETAENDAQKLWYVLQSVDFGSFHQPVHQIDVRFKYPVLKT